MKSLTSITPYQRYMINKPLISHKTSMPISPDKKSIGLTVTKVMYQRIQKVAKSRLWSISQTLSVFLDSYWDEWEKEMMDSDKITIPKKRKPKSEP